MADTDWTIGMCHNPTITYRPGGVEIDHLTYCRHAGTVPRWSRPGTDSAVVRHYCPRHADEIRAHEASIRARLDQARAARGEEPLAWHLWDRVRCPDGLGYVVGLPSAAAGTGYLVGLDDRQYGEPPRQFGAHQLASAV